MNTQLNCPDAESLVSLLDSANPESDHDTLAGHIDACETCQQRLETLVIDGFPTDPDYAHVGGDLRQAVKRAESLDDAALQRLTTAILDRTLTGSVGERISLDFLQPSEQGGSLGRLGQFEITDVVGRGGMGIVLKGRDTRLDRVVAIKVLAPELASNATARRRFRREAQAAAAVSHDHVVTTFAVEPGELPYLAMEFIDGQSLQQKLDRTGPLEVKEILRIGMQTACGLAAAHAQGLIHRDIKPSNILLQNSIERVQITDFGLARAADDVALTRTGEIAGTPLYMSPEQTEGGSVDVRSDLFSLGSVMYAMCTGRAPFRADSTMAVLNRVSNDTPRPIREVNSDIPGWLAGIIERLLEKDSAKRYQSAAEVADLLSRCLAHVQQPTVVQLPDVLVAADRIQSHVPWRPKWFLGMILLAVLFSSLVLAEATGLTQISASVISIVRGDGTLRIEVNDPSVHITIEGEDVVITGAGPQEVRLRPGQYRLSAERNGQHVPLERDLVSITRRGNEVVRVTLENPRPAQDFTDYESIPVGSISRERRLTGHTDVINDVAVSADGNRMLTGGRDRRVLLWDLDTGKILARFRQRGNVSAVALSPRGDRAGVAYRNGEVRIFDLTGDIHSQPVSQMWQQNRHSDNIFSLDFSADGSKLISTSEDKRAIVWEAETGKVVHEFPCHEYCFSGSLVSALHNEAIIPQEQDTFVVRNLDTGEAGLTLRVPVGVGRGVDSLAFSPDEQMIATGHVDGPIRLWDRSDGSLIRTIEGNTSSVKSLQFSEDSRHLISGGRDKTIRVFAVNDGTEIARVETDRIVSAKISLMGDGRRLISGGGYAWDPATDKWLADGDYDIHVWQLPESVWPQNQAADYQSVPAGAIKEIQRLSSPRGFVTSLAFTDRHVVSGRASYSFEYWNLETGACEHFEANQSVKAVALSPNRRLGAVAQQDSMNVWDMANRKLIHAFPAEGGPFRAVSFSPDGEQVIAGGESGIAIVWNVETGQELHRFQSSSMIKFCEFSPDGRQILIGGDDLVLIDTERNLESWRLDIAGFSHAAAFSPDGSRIATTFTTDDIAFGNTRFLPEIQLREAMTGRKIAGFSGHTAMIRGLRFLPDGRHLVSGSYDRTLRVWNVGSGAEVARVETDNHVTHVIAVSPDGRTVASAGGHFRKKFDHELRPHEMLGKDQNYVKDGDHDIRMWQLPKSVWPKTESATSGIAGDVSQAADAEAIDHADHSHP